MIECLQMILLNGVIKMTQQQEEISRILTLTVEEFNRKEQFLIEYDLSERCICSKFASYLERQLRGSCFSEYEVDVEYNRGMRGNEYAAKENPDTNQKMMVDLVIHKRGVNQYGEYDNLFCIEMKKGRQESKLLSDKRRLEMMVDINKGFHYKAGYMIIIISEHKQRNNKLEIESSYYAQTIY